MKKLFILSIVFTLFFISCKEEPVPEPEVNRAYCYLHHFIPGLAAVDWIVDDIAVEQELEYANYFPGAVVLDTDSEEVSFIVEHASTGQVLISQAVNLEKDKYYTVILTGVELDPVLRIQEIETAHPSAGKVKFQFLHAGIFYDSIDVYMGGSSSQYRIVTDLGFAELTEPFEANDFDARAAITVAVHDEEYNQDNVLLTSLYNDLIISEANYLCALAPSTLDPLSDLTLWIYDLPIE